MTRIYRTMVFLCIVCLLPTTAAFSESTRGRTRGSASPSSASAEHTVFVSIERDGVTETVVIGGLTSAPGYRLDPETGTRFVQFQASDAAKIAAALADAGIGSDRIFGVLLDLELPAASGTPRVQSATQVPPIDAGNAFRPVAPQPLPVDDGRLSLRPVNPQPLNPECGQCLNGNLCTYGGEDFCCTSGGAACSACKVCSG